MIKYVKCVGEIHIKFVFRSTLMAVNGSIWPPVDQQLSIAPHEQLGDEEVRGLLELPDIGYLTVKH